MIFNTMRTLLARRLQDEAADQWSSADKDDLLVVGISKLQAMILDLKPGAFMQISSFATVVDQDLYAKPTGILQMIRMELQNLTDSRYTELFPANFEALIDDNPDNTDTSTGQRYAEVGQHFLIRPAPSAVRTARIWFSPEISSANWDTAIQGSIPSALHTLPVDFAVVEMLSETAQPAVEAQVRIKVALDLLPAFYGRSNSKQKSSLQLDPSRY